MNLIRNTLIAAIGCIAFAAQAATYDVSYAFATGDTVHGTVVGTLAGTTLSNITSMNFQFDGIDFGSSLSAFTMNAATGNYDAGLTLSTIAANNNFIIADATNTYSFSFSVAPDTGLTQVAATNFNSLDHSAAVEDALQASWTVSVAAVPEPETLALMLAGLGCVGFVARRRAA